MFKLTIALVVSMVMFTHGLPLAKLVDENVKLETSEKEGTQDQPQDQKDEATGKFR